MDQKQQKMFKKYVLLFRCDYVSVYDHHQGAYM